MNVVDMPTLSRSWGIVLLGIVVTGVVVSGAVLDTSPVDRPPTAGDGSAALEIGAVDSEATDGSLRISALVSNPGQTPQTATVSLKLDGDGDGSYETTVERREVRFEGAAERTISFQQSTDRMANGDYRYGVFVGDSNASASDEQTVTVRLQDPPELRLTGVPSRLEVVRGETATLSFEVTNVGDATRSRLVSLHVDSDGDGTFDAEEELDDAILELESDQTTEVSLDLSTADVEPGTHRFAVNTETETVTGTLTVLKPATFDVAFDANRTTVTRGDPVNGTVTVTNTGDVEATETVRVGVANGTENVTRNVTLDGGSETAFDVSLATENLTGGDTAFVASVGAANDTETVYVKAPYYEVYRVRDTKMGRSGSDLRVTIEARVRNTGDVPGNETVRLMIDVDGDDEPERVGIERSLALDVDERATVEFEVATRMSDADAEPRLPVGTYIYGVYTNESSRTNVFVVRDDPDTTDLSTGSSTGGDTTDDGADGGDSSGPSPEPTEYATLDEISQSKYGMYFDELSGQTHHQVREIHTRQPFADGLAVTDVLTREELARQKYDVDIEGRDFDYGALDVELRQQIEADFDAQFTSDEGDRYESWDELAQRLYGTDFESLTEAQRQEVKDRYAEQFD